MPNKLFMIAISLLVLLGGCTTKPKLPVPGSNPPVAAVQENVAAYRDKAVTWGGIILETSTRKDITEITILSKRLTQSTRPVEQDASLGRFIAQTKDFLDPAVYATNREITIHGRVLRKEKRKIGDYEYTYPIIVIDSFYLWPPRPKEDPYRYDPWYDPWYGPWYQPYPYHHHPRRLESVTVLK